MKYVPVTPGGTILIHLESRSNKRAGAKLMEDARHMPYPDKQAFIDRGYTVEEWVTDEQDKKRV